MDKKEEKKIIRQEFLIGERALFMGKNLDIYDTIFDDGESPLKESRDINPVRQHVQMEVSAVVQQEHRCGGLPLV